MKERPILFSAPMVRAILDGRKTQTRRVVKPQPPDFHEPPFKTSGGKWVTCDNRPPDILKTYLMQCPHGKPGDRLWVKETWRPHQVAPTSWDLDIEYAADRVTRRIYDGEFGERDWNMPKAAATGNVSPLFMPRWASRITLEITGVRVERLNEISEADALAEGVEPIKGGYFRHYMPGWTQHTLSARSSFLTLWKSINGPDSWDANPWVWVIEFQRVEQLAKAA